MENKKYNGWTNHATWKVNLEQISDIDTDYWSDFIEYNRGSEREEYDLGQHIKDYVEEQISMQVTPLTNNLAENYALAFISDVNWREIAEHILDTYKENYRCYNCNDKIDEDERYKTHYCSEECYKEEELLATHPKG